MVGRLCFAMSMIALLAGCPAGDDDYIQKPPGPGPPGNGNGGDAGADAPLDGGSGVVRSRVCVLTDLRQPTSCSPNNNVGVVVRELGTQNQATSGANGAFELTPTATGVAFLEVGTGSTALVPSIVAIDADDAPDTIPVPAAVEYNALRTRLGLNIPDGSGDVVIYFLDRSNRPLPGVTVQVADGSLNEPYYDIAAGMQWVPGADTGPYGASLVAGVAEGTTTFLATSAELEDLSIAGVRVVEGHVSFVTSQLAP
jgi:hypothetical protein